MAYLPAALVKLSAAKPALRHDEFVRQHDSLVRRFTNWPESLRVSIPPTPSRCIADPEFFWSEHDRTSGYRKMQLLGAVFSSLDATIQELHERPPLLLEAKELCLAHLREAGVEVPEIVSENNSAWIEFFEEGYREYVQRRGEFEKLEHASNNGVFETFEAALTEVVAAVTQLVRGTAAERCMTVALLHSRRRSRPMIDPVDRFYFRTHAPLIEELTGGARRYHDLLMDSLHTRVAGILERA